MVTLRQSTSRRNQPGLGKKGGRREVPKRSLPPPERVSPSRAGPAGAERGHCPACAPPGSEVCAPNEKKDRHHPRRNHACIGPLALAGERERTGKHRGAIGHPLSGADFRRSTVRIAHTRYAVDEPLTVTMRFGSTIMLLRTLAACDFPRLTCVRPSTPRNAPSAAQGGGTQGR